MTSNSLARRTLTGCAVLAASLCTAMTAVPAGASAAAAAGPGRASHGQAKAFPPKANSAWAYDTTSPGTWISAIEAYNQQAGAGHQLGEVYSYGSDVEMYCPDNDGTQCTQDDLLSDYTPSSDGPARTQAYYQAFDASGSHSLIISPIIDGNTGPAGFTQGFSQLSPDLAAGFADKVASQVCADPYVDGIQFDIEPFDVTTQNGQYYFYLRMAQDFAGKQGGHPGQDPYGCVSDSHPRGRFFSVFTFAASIQPGTQSAADVQKIVSAYGNGYFMDSLYDLSSAPAGTLNGIAAYRSAVQTEVSDTKRWADRLHIRYGYGVPASASAHEFTTCTATAGASGSCVPDATGAAGYPMISYARAAVTAITRAKAQNDPRYMGAAIWDFGDSVSVNGLDFGPVPAPADVLGYFAKNLPGARTHGR